MAASAVPRSIGGSGVSQAAAQLFDMRGEHAVQLPAEVHQQARDLKHPAGVDEASQAAQQVASLTAYSLLNSHIALTMFCSAPKMHVICYFFSITRGRSREYYKFVHTWCI